MNVQSDSESISYTWIIPTGDPNFVRIRVSTQVSISYLEDIGSLIHEGMFLPQQIDNETLEGGRLSILPTDQREFVELISEITVPAGQIAHLAQFSRPRSLVH